MDNQGWIKLHRKLADTSWANKPNYISLWVHLLLKANHKPKEFIWNGKTIIIKEGQMITGRKELSKLTGIKPTTLERILETLEIGHQIEQQKTTKFRLITVLKWEEYQKERQENGQQTDNKRTTNGHKQECNNDNNVNNKESGAEAPTPSQIMTKFINEPEEQEKVILALEGRGMAREVSSAEIKKFLNYWCELTKSGKQQRWQTEKTFELQRRLATWFNNAQKFNKTNIIKSL